MLSKENTHTGFLTDMQKCVILTDNGSGLRKPRNINCGSDAEQRPGRVLHLCATRASLSDTQAKCKCSAALCGLHSLGRSAAFNEVSASDSIKLLTTTEYSNAALWRCTDVRSQPRRAPCTISGIRALVGFPPFLSTFYISSR